MSDNNYWAEKQKRNSDLVFAARSRLLTDEEMGEIAKQGIDIFLSYYPSGDDGAVSYSYNTADLERRLNDLLLQQFRFRAIATELQPRDGIRETDDATTT